MMVPISYPRWCSRVCRCLTPSTERMLYLIPSFAWGCRALAAIGVGALALIATAATPASAAYTFTTLDVPAGTDTEAAGISGGTIVGIYSANGVNHGFVYNGGTFTTLDDPSAAPGGTTYPSGVSGSTIVGSYYVAGSGSGFHGFIYDGSTYTTLDDPSAAAPYPARGTSAYGISGSTVVGSYDS